MEAWQLNELNCTNYLNSYYGKNGFSFIGTGGSNANDSDIAVYKNGQRLFSIEAKMPGAQCGQFVLLPSGSNFEFSPRNKSIQTQTTQKIIDYMNSYYSMFVNPGTAGVALNCSKEYFYSWIIEYYKSKGTKFFIVGCVDSFIIFPIDKFPEYFDVSACYREKKSGSNHPSLKNIPEIQMLLASNGIVFNNLGFSDGHCYVSISQERGKFQLKGSEYDYQFNPEGGNNYQIRRLSNTRNSNVIFTIGLLKGQDKTDLDIFNSIFLK
jgi:hypothetical protein